MTRGWRSLAGGTLLLAAVAVAGLGLKSWRHGAPRPLRPIPSARRPVLLVTVDTTRADHLAPYGAKDVATPILADLASAGILFERASSVAPITLVAHTSLLTGLYPMQHGVRTNGLHYVRAELVTLAERLRARGFRTAAFVSAAVLDRRYGLDQGFEVYNDDLSTGRERHPHMVADRPAEATVAAARAWLDTLDPKEDFFLWVHLYDPHAPYSPPPPFRDLYRERLYDGEIAYMDSQIGRLLEHPRLGKDRAVTMVIGDHGESLGEHRENTHAILTYEATLHVPWIARIPTGPAGLRIDTPVSQVDLVPTLLDLLGMDAAPGLPGVSLVGLMEGRVTSVDRYLYSESYLPFHTYGWAKLRVIRRGDWKYVEAPKPELYDLRRDPRELANRIDQAPGMAHDLARDLKETFGSGAESDQETTLALDADAAERLRSLGYLSVGTPRVRPEAERPDPKDVVDLHVGLEAARTLMESGLFAEASNRLQAVLARDPDNLAALMDLASALEGGGKAAEAAAAAERALRLDPKYPHTSLLLAGIESRRGNRGQALRLVESAIGLDPRDPEARIQQALLLDQMGRPGDAATVIREAEARSPGEPRLEALYAEMVEERSGGLDAAEHRVRAALARDPFLVMAWRILGDVLERAARADAAVDAYQTGLKRQPDDAELHARLGLLLARRGAAQEAEMHLREAIRLGDGPRSDLHVALGACLAESGRLDDALREYDTVLSVQPRNPGARNNRAVALYRQKHVDQAVAEWTKLVAEFPRQADAYNNLSAVAIDRGEWTKAEAHARRSVSLAPGVAEAWSNMGIALDEEGRRREAEEDFRKALALDPTYWQARNNLATTLRKQGRSREAAENFEEVLQRVPTQPDVHLELGDLYWGALHDPERARRHYNAFLHGAPKHPRAAEIRRRLSESP